MSILLFHEVSWWVWVHMCTRASTLSWKVKELLILTCYSKSQKQLLASTHCTGQPTDCSAVVCKLQHPPSCMPECQPVVCFWRLWEDLCPTFSAPFFPRLPWSCPSTPGRHVELAGPTLTGQKGGIWEGWKGCSLQQVVPVHLCISGPVNQRNSKKDHEFNKTPCSERQG